MKKRFLLFGILCAFAGLSVSAQQLENGSFEEWTTSKTENGSTLDAANGKTFQRPGIEPKHWSGSSIVQVISAELISKETKDVKIGSSCAKLYNKFVGFAGIGSVAPGYLTLGTPWVAADMGNVANSGGGTFGGVEFTFIPDAIAGHLKRTDSSGEVSKVIAYLWNGEFNSNIGKLNSMNTPAKNVERAVLGKEGAGTVSGNGKLVASLERTYENTELNNWLDFVIPFNYIEGAGAPTMMNVIVCAGNYWDRNALQKTSTLLVDGLKFIYHSKLESLSVNGVAVPNFDKNIYEYQMSGSVLPTSDQIKAVVDGKSAQATVEIDASKALVTITVSNVGADSDNLSSHIYKLQYEKKREGARYQGTLDINFGGGISIPNQSVYIEFASDGKSCKFALYDFSLDGSTSIGDIIVENVQINFDETGEYRSFAGSKQGISLAGGAIIADAELSGTEHFYGGHLVMNINVEWIQDPSNPESARIPIPVKFNGGIDKTSGVENIQNINATAYGVNGALVVNGFEGMARVYSMDGRLVKAAWVNTEAQLDLTAGLYIVRLGNKAVKVVVR